MERVSSSVVWVSKSFYWSIHNFSDVCGLKVDMSRKPLRGKEYRSLLDIDSILSPVFCVGIAEDGTLCRWIVKLVKGTSNSSQLDLHLELSQGQADCDGDRLLPYECFFKYGIHVIGSNDKPVFSKVNESIVFLKSEHCLIEPAFLTMEHLLEQGSELIHNDTLTFQIDLQVLSDIVHFVVDQELPPPPIFAPSSSTRNGPLSPPQWQEMITKSQSTLAKSTLQSMWKTGHQWDAVIESSGTATQFQIHKSVLSGASPVFAAAFSHDLTEKLDNRIVISDISKNTLELLLRFIYSDVTGAEKEWECVDSLAEILNAAEKYQIPALKAVCFSKLCQAITLNNAAKVCVLVHLFRPEDESVTNYVYDYIIKNIGLLKKTEEFKRSLQEVPEVFAPLLMHLGGNQN